MIEMGKKYQTRNGFPVRILCTDRDERNSGSCHFPVVGLVDHGGERELFCWTNTGSRKGYACDDAFDLVSIPTKHEGWILVNALGQWFGGDIFTAERWAQEESAKWGSGVHSAHVTWED